MKKRKDEISKKFILGPEDEEELKRQLEAIKKGDPA
jgi:hypothetical protein